MAGPQISKSTARSLKSSPDHLVKGIAVYDYPGSADVILVEELEKGRRLGFVS